MKRLLLLFAGIGMVVCSGRCADAMPVMADLSAADFPRLAGETDDSGRLQRAIDATGPERVLYVPYGVYPVSRTLVVTNAASLLLHKSATIRAIAKMSYVVSIDMGKGSAWNWGAIRAGAPFDQALFIRGGHIDGNGLASCLYLQKYFHYSIRDMVFLNGSPYGLHVGKRGCEIIANNLYFRTIKSGLAGNVALFSEGCDSQYSDLVAVDYTTGLRVRGSSNTFTRFHVWGGPVPPVAKGRLPEMLEGSVNFEMGGGMNTLRDCYADTGEVGFLVTGWAQLITGCWYYNNPGFHLKKVTIIRQMPSSGKLRVEDCHFRATGPETTLYEGTGAVSWRDMVYDNFTNEGSLPGKAICEPDCPAAKSADDWEFIVCSAQGKYISPAGEFSKPQTARALSINVPLHNIAKRFPNAGAGNAIVIRARATDDNTQAFELTISQNDGQVWGKDRVMLKREWQVISIPFSELRYFSHYKDIPKLQPGDRPDARKMTCIRCMYGNWMSDGTADKAHGFEIFSIRIVGR